MKKIRSALDTLYAASGAAAVLFLVLIAALTLAQIAGRLVLSVNTVRSHLERIRDKTGARRRTDLARYAFQAGIDPAAPPA